MCAERTKKHLSMFKEGKEAFFGQLKKECLKICLKLLSNKELINRVKKAGRKKSNKRKIRKLRFYKKYFKKKKK